MTQHNYSYSFKLLVENTLCNIEFIHNISVFKGDGIYDLYHIIPDTVLMLLTE